MQRQRGVGAFAVRREGVQSKLKPRGARHEHEPVASGVLQDPKMRHAWRPDVACAGPHQPVDDLTGFQLG